MLAELTGLIIGDTWSLVLLPSLSSDFWIGDSGASCHMTNDASKMYCVRPPPLDQRGVITNDGTRLRVECIGNVDVIFHGRSEEQITLIDVSYVPDLKLFFFSFHKAQQTYVIILDAALKFNIFSFHKAQQTHVIILDATGAHIMGKNLSFPREKSGSYL
ncbi:unnamed protein product [Ascophyllum nodosum]